jgi:hypothetical protein
MSSSVTWTRFAVAKILPIPVSIWNRFRAFLKDDRSGTVSLHVKRGTVLGATFTENVPSAAPASPQPEDIVESRSSNHSA